MELFLKRKYYKPGYIIGKLYVEGDVYHKTQRYLCDTLEPKSGHLTASMKLSEIKRIKKQLGAVAIPPGRYPVLITKSTKFKKWLPLLVGVPGFSGIRIHAGNCPEDTRGCILPGLNRRKGMVLNSNACLSEIMHLLQDSYTRGDAVWVRIKA